jgi:two-component sensor histidine kinase
MTFRLSSLLNPLRPQPGLQGLASCLLLWVPLVAAALDLAFGGAHDFWHRWLISASIADTVCLVCFGGSILLRHVVFVFFLKPKKDAKPHGAPFYFGLSALLMPCVLPLGLWVGARVGGFIGRPYAPDLSNYRAGLGFGAVMVALFFLQWARAEARDRVRDLENANLKAQLAALTAEMNPHMLFNALNTIASLVHSNPDRAEQTVLELAEVYRGILRAAGGATHPLADELRLCEAYLRVEDARYGERLKVDFAIDDAVDASAVRVPMLVLQPLVENAVQHGIAPRASGGSVSVHVTPGSDDRDAITVVVEDDGIGFGRSERAGNGRALLNCKERLRLKYGEHATLDVAARKEGGTRARLTLPISSATSATLATTATT